MTNFTGLLGAPIENMRNLIGTTSAFKTWVGAVSDAEGIARVYAILEDEDTITRPMALVTYMDGDYDMNRDAAGLGHNCFNKTNTLSVVFQKNVDAYSQATIKTFINEISDILAGMLDISGSENIMITDNINFRGFSQGEDGEATRYYAIFGIGWEM